MRWKRLMVCLLAAGVLTSCTLLPEEEEEPPVPVPPEVPEEELEVTLIVFWPSYTLPS